MQCYLFAVYIFLCYFIYLVLFISDVPILKTALFIILLDIYYITSALMCILVRTDAATFLWNCLLTANALFTRT